MAWAHNGSAAIHWREEGAGEPLLMIMGLGGSSLAWYRLLPHVRAQARAIVFDNRGTGSSSRIEGGRITLRDMVDDAVAVLDAADVERAHVFGVSMGGMIAQRLAIHHRDRVSSLVLGCTTAQSRAGVPPWRLMAAAGLRGVAPERAFALLLPALYARRTREQHMDRIRDDMRMRMREATPSSTVISQMLAVGSHDARLRLSELDGLPTTVIHGLEDALIPVARGRELARLIPGAELREIPGAGHVLTTDAEPETVAAVVGHLDARRAAA